MRFVAGVASALFAPDRAFAARANPAFRLYALLALLLAAVVAGETNGPAAYQRPRTAPHRPGGVARHVAEQRSTSFAEPEEVDRRQAAAYRRLTAPTGAAAKTGAVLLSGLILLAAVFLTWLALLVLAEFFGG